MMVMTMLINTLREVRIFHHNLICMHVRYMFAYVGLYMYLYRPYYYCHKKFVSVSVALNITMANIYSMYSFRLSDYLAAFYRLTLPHIRIFVNTEVDEKHHRYVVYGSYPNILIR